MRHGVSCALVMLLVGLGAMACTPDVASGQYSCDPTAMSACPVGWLCLPFADEHRCFNEQGICGNFVLEAGEECDGTDFAGRICSDHNHDSGSMVPRCDDRCRVICPRCGNGTIDQNIVQIYGHSEDATSFEEDCDNGTLNSDSAPDACRTDCSQPRCGDGVVDTNENIETCHEDCGVLDVAADGFICVIKGDRSIWCWPHASFGLGDEAGTTTSDSPVRIAGVDDAIGVDVGGDHACAIRGDRTVWCWGANDHAQLGDGTTEPRPAPVQAPEISDASNIACGRDFSCVVKLDQSVWCWGANNRGQLGDGQRQHPECDPLEVCELADRSTLPVQVLLSTGAHAVVAGADHACALLVDGSASCWGVNNHGQLGDGNASHEWCDGMDCSSVPVLVSGLTDVRDIDMKLNHTCAVASPGAPGVWCWGENSFGEIGAPTVELLETHEPRRVQGLSAPVQIAVGEDHSCAVEQGGVVWCWGNNMFAQLGLGIAGPGSSSPVQSTVTGVRMISAAATLWTIVVREDYTASWWGKKDGEVWGSTSVTGLLGQCAVD